MNRREAVAGIAANLMIVSPRVAFGSQANSAVSLGILGTGNRGRYDTNFLAKDPRTKIVALCDLYPDQLDQTKTDIPAVNAAKTFKRYQDVLNESGIDAVVITVPVYLHPEFFEA